MCWYFGWQHEVVFNVVGHVSYAMLSLVSSTWMADRLQAGIPSRYVNGQLAQLSFLSTFYPSGVEIE